MTYNYNRPVRSRSLLRCVLVACVSCVSCGSPARTVAEPDAHILNQTSHKMHCSYFELLADRLHAQLEEIMHFESPLHHLLTFSSRLISS
uniref:Secreted protein n=1 Tax=Myripristis murdjan TaxID=586833 RepID=A0A667WLJ6_9TELE